MNKFVIIGDSCSDLNMQLRKGNGIDDLASLYLTYDNQSIPASLDWEKISAKDYYDIMRNGTRVLSSQATAVDYEELFEKYLKDGYDIVSISCSSALSATVKSSYVARDNLKEKYPQAKIFCIDALVSAGGQGMLCILASRLRSQGKSAEETAQLIEEYKMFMQQAGTVDDLNFLKRSGRISASSALFGSLLGIKPIVISNDHGENVAIKKVKGRQKSLRELVDYTIANYTGKIMEEIYISHGDCLQDAEFCKELILEKMPSAKISIVYLNPVVGASCGPNMLAIYFMGTPKPNTQNV